MAEPPLGPLLCAHSCLTPAAQQVQGVAVLCVVGCPVPPSCRGWPGAFSIGSLNQCFICSFVGSSLCMCVLVAGVQCVGSVAHLHPPSSAYVALHQPCSSGVRHRWYLSHAVRLHGVCGGLARLSSRLPHHDCPSLGCGHLHCWQPCVAATVCVVSPCCHHADCWAERQGGSCWFI